MLKKKLRSLNVIVYDWNEKKAKYYDVVPYFVTEIGKSRFCTRDELKSKVVSLGKYMFWSRCEWEITVGPWPEREWLNQFIVRNNINFSQESEQFKVVKEIQKKINDGRDIIDSWSQIEVNIEILLDILEPIFVKLKR